jgi:predicted methyltransferase
MIAVVDETRAVARKTMARLAVHPMRVRDIWKSVVQDSASVRKTVTVFYWLRDNGFIQKTGQDYCAPYELTDKGRRFYRALS